MTKTMKMTEKITTNLMVMQLAIAEVHLPTLGYSHRFYVEVGIGGCLRGAGPASAARDG